MLRERHVATFYLGGTQILQDPMANNNVLRTEIARLGRKEADLHRDLAKQQAEATKQSREAGKKSEAAAKSRVGSSARSYLRASEAASKKEADVMKNVAELKRKIADVQKVKAAKENALRLAEETARKAVGKARENERRKELAHAREVARVTAPVRHVILEPPKPETLRVLYLTANPEATETTIANPDGSVATNGTWLRTEAELRSVKKEIRGALHRDAVDLSHMPAATYEDMLDGLNDKRPHVVHFSGHGGGRGLLFDNGSASEPAGVDVSYASLAAFLAATDYPPRLLVLNACDTLDGAEVLLPTVPVVIAMSDTISDAAAAIFASRFYAAIAGGQSVGSALAQAKAVLTVIHSSEKDLPQFLAREGVDVSSLVLVSAAGC